MLIRSTAVNSGISGRGTLDTEDPEEVDIPNRSICPSTFFRREEAMPSSTRSYTATSWERLAPRLSKAPQRMRFSTARLFMSVQSNIRWQKSWKEVKSPSCCRWRTTAWIKPRPMFFTATRPKRMPPSSTVNRS